MILTEIRDWCRYWLGWLRQQLRHPVDRDQWCDTCKHWR